MLVVTRKVGERVRVRCRETGAVVWVSFREPKAGKLQMAFDDDARRFEVLREELVDDEPEGRAAS